MVELHQCPRLVVLASCQSAGSGVEARPVMKARWQRSGRDWPEAGIPAVVAMQGNVSMARSMPFMPGSSRSSSVMARSIGPWRWRGGGARTARLVDASAVPRLEEWAYLV